jgi:hypothetical protein
LPLTMSSGGMRTHGSCVMNATHMPDPSSGIPTPSHASAIGWSSMTILRTTRTDTTGDETWSRPVRYVLPPGMSSGTLSQAWTTSRACASVRATIAGGKKVIGDEPAQMSGDGGLCRHLG